jgi:hypothetical protein
MIFFRQYIEKPVTGTRDFRCVLTNEKAGARERISRSGRYSELSILEHRKRNGGEVFRITAMADGNAVAAVGSPDLTEMATFFSATKNRLCARI